LNTDRLGQEPSATIHKRFLAPAGRSHPATIRRPVAKSIPVSKTGSRHRHRPCSSAANHSLYSDHSWGHGYCAILGSPVYEVALCKTIVAEEFFCHYQFSGEASAN